MRYGFAAFIIFCCYGLAAFAESETLERRFSVATGYADKIFNSNEGLVHVPLSGIQAYTKLFDAVEDNFSRHWGIKLLTTTVELPLSYWMLFSFFTPFHEFGHARAYAAGGQDYSFGINSYGKDFSRLNFWTLSGLSLITPPIGFPGSGIAWATPAGRISMAPALEEFWGPGGFDIIKSASGLNNQTFLAKRIAKNIYDKNGHMLYFQHYVGNKIAPFVYTLVYENNALGLGEMNDVGSILKSYGKKGYTISAGDIKLQSWLTLASGTTFSLLRAYYDYFAHDSKVARPAEIFGLRVPDLNGYINAKGLSLEVDTGYRFSSSFSAGLAYEFIWKGEFDQQFTPSTRFNLASLAPVLNEFWLEADVVIGKGVGGSIKADYAPFALDNGGFWSRFAYSAGLSVYNAYTLFGERNIPSFADAKGVALGFDAAIHLRY